MRLSLFPYSVFAHNVRKLNKLYITCFKYFRILVPRAAFLLFRGAGQKERGSGDENDTFGEVFKARDLLKDIRRVSLAFSRYNICKRRVEIYPIRHSLPKNTSVFLVLYSYFFLDHRIPTTILHDFGKL